MEGGCCSKGGLLIGGGGVLGCGVFLGAEAWLSLSCTMESEINKPHTGMAHTAATTAGQLGAIKQPVQAKSVEGDITRLRA